MDFLFRREEEDRSIKVEELDHDEETREDCVDSEEKPKKKSKRRPKEEYVGPDTSSLTAFLVSLLSFSEPSDVYVDGNGTEGSDSDEENVGSSSHTISKESNDEFEKVACFTGTIGSRQRGNVEKSSSKTISREDSDADWQLVSEHDLVSSNTLTDPPRVQLVNQQPQLELAEPVKLPTMYEPSSLLSENLRATIYSNLPNLAKGRQWVLLYSTKKHGISLRTLYRKAALIPGPWLLVAGDRLGAVFGGLLSSPLKPALKKKYQGTSDSFVFTNVSGYPQVFRPSGRNRYYNLCTNEALAFGGGGHFALHIDSELLYGTSAACETYGNGGLATTEDFTLKDVELWGFAHASKYSPEPSLRDHQVMYGFYNW